MGSSSGTSSGSSPIQNSGSEEDLKALINQRKRKRMISNRESAQRSRVRKQKHLDDLMAQVAQFKEENRQIIGSINISTQHYLNVEAQNSVLRAQAGELSHRLESLNEIVNANNCVTAFDDHGFLNPLNLPYLNQPIMASADHLFNEYY